MGSGATPTTPTTPLSEAVPEPVASKPPVDQLVLTTEGMATLVLGSSPSFSDPDSDLISRTEIQPCEGGPSRFSWLPNYPDVDPEEPPFVVAVDNDRLEAVMTSDSRIVTDKGIRVGATRQQLMDAYPSGFDITTAGVESDVFVIVGEKGSLVYELALDTAGWGELGDTVIFMSAVTYDPTQIYPMSGSEWYGTGSYC